jgi:hypothetical protein
MAHCQRYLEQEPLVKLSFLVSENCAILQRESKVQLQTAYVHNAAYGMSAVIIHCNSSIYRNFLFIWSQKHHVYLVFRNCGVNAMLRP